MCIVKSPSRRPKRQSETHPHRPFASNAHSPTKSMLLPTTDSHILSVSLFSTVVIVRNKLSEPSTPLDPSSLLTPSLRGAGKGVDHPTSEGLSRLQVLHFCSRENTLRQRGSIKSIARPIPLLSIYWKIPRPLRQMLGTSSASSPPTRPSQSTPTRPRSLTSPSRWGPDPTSST